MGREEVDRHNGLVTLVDLMKNHLDSSVDGASKLRMVLCGFLLNLTNTHGKESAIPQKRLFFTTSLHLSALVDDASDAFVFVPDEDVPKAELPFSPWLQWP